MSQVYAPGRRGNQILVAPSGSPLIITNFADPNFWTPVLTSDAATMVFDSNGQPLITGAVAYAAPPQRHSTGVLSRHRLFPHPTSGGIIEVQCRFTEFLMPAPNPVAGDIAGYGFAFDCLTPGSVGANGNAIYGGWVNATATWMAVWAVWGDFQTSNLNANNVNAPGAAVTEFIINVRIQYGAQLTWLINDNLRPRFSINGGALTDLVLTAAGHMGTHIQHGIPFFLGYFGASRHVTTRARLVEFRLISGMLAD